MAEYHQFLPAMVAKQKNGEEKQLVPFYAYLCK
jgi:hypothetical protein